MTEAELRKHYDLKPCKNPSHPFGIWKLIGEWVFAEDYWAQLVGDRKQTIHFALTSTENHHGIKLTSIVIWRLKVIWSILK